MVGNIFENCLQTSDSTESLCSVHPVFCSIHRNYNAGLWQKAKIEVEKENYQIQYQIDEKRLCICPGSPKHTTCYYQSNYYDRNKMYKVFDQDWDRRRKQVIFVFFFWLFIFNYAPFTLFCFIFGENGFSPKINISPASLYICPVNNLIVVVFPAPEGPKYPNI